MDGFVAPERWPEPVKALGIEGNIVLVLPTTANVTALLDELDMPVIGKGHRPGQTPAEMLQRVASGQRPPLIVVHTDQLYLERDATVLVHFADRSVFMSPVEYILSHTYGYHLVVWGAKGFRGIGCGASLDVIAHGLRDHLEQCAVLGPDWVEADAQGRRSLDQRRRLARRHIRFVGSSIARAYRDHADIAGKLLERVGRVETVCRESRA